jgi:hypothetical protein
MADDKIKKARDLVDEGKYAQARRLLKGNTDPRARRLMEEIDDLAPANSGGTGFRDFLHVILLGLVFTALFGGIGYAIASGMGIPQTVATTPTRESQVQSPSGDETPDGQQNVAIEPSATPPPTEIPCEAQAWWDANNATTAQVVTGAIDLKIETSGQQIQSAKQAFDNWRSTIESETVAPCLSAVKQAIVSAAPGVEALYNAFLTTSTEQSRAQALVRAMDALLPVTDELDKLSVSGGDSAWIGTVQDFTRGECAAKRWYNEIILGKDYKRFFALFDALDYNQIGAATSSLREMQGLRGSFQADSAAFPECLKTASDALLAAMEGFIGFGNSRLQGDAANADAQFNAANTSLATFYGELSKLDASLSGIRLKQ